MTIKVVTIGGNMESNKAKQIQKNEAKKLSINSFAMKKLYD